VLAGNGDRTFQTPGDVYPTGSDAVLTQITTADLRGNGIRDLVAAGTDAFVLLSNGDGSFLASKTYRVRDSINGLRLQICAELASWTSLWGLRSVALSPRYLAPVMERFQRCWA
jgi:hypothetical protein